jgi:hypothetical protein
MQTDLNDPNLTDRELWELVRTAQAELDEASNALHRPDAIKLDLASRSDLRDRVAELSLNLVRLQNRFRRTTDFGALGPETFR